MSAISTSRTRQKRSVSINSFTNSHFLQNCCNLSNCADNLSNCADRREFLTHHQSIVKDFMILVTIVNLCTNLSTRYLPYGAVHHPSIPLKMYSSVK